MKQNVVPVDSAAQEINDMGWGDSRYVIVSMSELIRIPQFAEFMKKSVRPATRTEILVPEENIPLLEKNGQAYETDEEGRVFWIREGIDIDDIKDFLVEYVEASPTAQLAVDFVTHRTADNQVVTCERYCTYHKNSKFVEKDLYDELNEMQKTSTLGG